jgi:putative ABC transport system permease protein
VRFLINLAWQDLRQSGHSLWVFCVCLTLGVSLITATGGLYRQVSDGLLSDTRNLMGGDLQVDARSPLPANTLEWINTNGTSSLMIELRSMMGTANGRFHLVELLSVDDRYPLYGKLDLGPQQELDAAVGFENGRWGAALDPVLAERLDLGVGDEVLIGSLSMEVRALIEHQPDRSLSADWRGPPVMISEGALGESGLVQPGSRLDYEYRVRTDINTDTWRDRFIDTFPDSDWEIRTFNDRSERMAEVLAQIASGLLLIGFTTLFIGGLGVFNSIQAYLQGKLATIATIRALGLRNKKLATVYLLQIAILSCGASLTGVIAGVVLALVGVTVVAQQLPVAATLSVLVIPSFIAFCFGLLTAFTFALPAIGRALSIEPAALFRGINQSNTETPRAYWMATLIGIVLIILLVLIAIPDPLFGLSFILIIGLLLAMLDGLVKGVRALASSLSDHPVLTGRLALRLALANLYRPGSPLRTSLLSLGSALTLLVACTLVVTALLKLVKDTIPEESPALVFYDISADQLDDVIGAVQQAPDLVRMDTAPLVLARLAKVNGEELRDSQIQKRVVEARDEHKLSYIANNIDGLTIDRGSWWDSNDTEQAYVAMEDREADQLGLKVGDVLTFTITGQLLEAKLAAIYSQKGIQTQFWFEAILSEGALDPFIYRYVGAAYMGHEYAIAIQDNIATIAPNVVTVRTEEILETATALLSQATAGLAVVAAVSLTASLLVLISIMATSRARQVYDATVLHSLGARMKVIKQGLQFEYLLLGLLTSLFAVILGSAVAIPLLVYQIKIPAENLIWVGVITALASSTLCLGLGSRYLINRLRLNPALLLRSEA